MPNLSRRVGELEKCQSVDLPEMVLVTQRAGMSRDDALARYEAAHGAIGDRDAVVLVGVAAAS